MSICLASGRDTQQAAPHVHTNKKAGATNMKFTLCRRKTRLGPRMSYSKETGGKHLLVVALYGLKAVQLQMTQVQALTREAQIPQTLPKSASVRP